ncbi:hypothetical protein B9Z55_021467 [Caenorhabditis nigoni]|uniref:Uncharacterized protein n=1 Tax=Caenorhabditis nigoni TaxID=1611254 RepID=A0A2G5TS92_9PELO|nr:hypothetical protein B9Z55_021467 [Caenorhabditis nigoni]
MKILVFLCFFKLFVSYKSYNLRDELFKNFHYVEKIENFYIEDKNEMLNMMNEMRRTHAKAHAIPNMWKLVTKFLQEWSEDLVEKIKKLRPEDCQSLTPENGYRFFFPNNRSHPYYHKESWWFITFFHYEEDFQSLKKNYGNVTINFVETLLEEQKYIGCGPYKCENYRTRWEDFTLRNEDKTKKVGGFNEICLIGPQSRFTFQAFTDVREYAEPGSMCKFEGGVNQDGLCVLEESSGASEVVNFQIWILAFLIFLKCE